LVAVISAAACGSSPSGSADARTDAGAARDARGDAPAPTDVGMEASPDGLGDAGHDAVFDTPLADASPDVALDAPVDGNGDAVADVAAEVGDASGTSDVPTDGNADRGDAAPDPLSPYHWVVLPAPLGIGITAIAVDGDGVLYAGGGSVSGAPGAGIFTSTDEGGSWHPANRGIYDFHVAGLAAAGTTIYAGTAGLLRSVDRGATWQQVTPPAGQGQVSVIGAQGDLVMVASNYGGNMFYSSIDGGKTFAPGQFASLGISSIEVLSAGSVILRAGDSGVVRSIDKGVTFNAVQGIDDGFGLSAQLRCDGVNTCYANAHTTTNNLDQPVLVKSTDAGATWTALGRAGATILAVSDTGLLYIASGAMIARSDDGGATFMLIQRPPTLGASEPSCGGPYTARGDKLFAACSDGVYKSYDRGQHWQAASGSPATGAITGFVYGMFVDTTSTALGASGDIYLMSYEAVSGSALQRSIDGGWTWQTLAAPFNASSCIVTAAGALECAGISGAPGTLPLGRSDDHGVTWHGVALPAVTPPQSAFVATALATVGATVYAVGNAAVGNGVARSDDGGLTFQLLPGSLSVEYLQTLGNGHLLAQAQVQGLNTTFRSTDRGATWQTLPRSLPLPLIEEPDGRLLFLDPFAGIDITSDEGDTVQLLPAHGVLPSRPDWIAQDGAGRLFVVGPGYAPGVNYGAPLETYASVDDSATWGPMPNPLPNPNVRASATDKQGRLLVATTGGVFRLASDADPGPPMPDAGAASP